MEYETVTIPRLAYEDLLYKESVLEALSCGGVDNWDGYSDALQVLNDDE